MSLLSAHSLQKIYLNPKSLINDLLQPLVDCGMTMEPQMVVTPRLCGQFWRAKLYLGWPSKVTISAVHTTVAGAEENAYLLACDLFKASSIHPLLAYHVVIYLCKVLTCEKKKK